MYAQSRNRTVSKIILSSILITILIDVNPWFAVEAVALNRMGPPRENSIEPIDVRGVEDMDLKNQNPFVVYSSEPQLSSLINSYYDQNKMMLDDVYDSIPLDVIEERKHKKDIWQKLINRMNHEVIRRKLLIKILDPLMSHSQSERPDESNSLRSPTRVPIFNGLVAPSKYGWVSSKLGQIQDLEGVGGDENDDESSLPSPASTSKRQIRYHQCYFNPISCFKKR